MQKVGQTRFLARRSLLGMILLGASLVAQAGVIQHDPSESDPYQYDMAPDYPPYQSLAESCPSVGRLELDIPHLGSVSRGSGTLITPVWILTAAHVVHAAEFAAHDIDLSSAGTFFDFDDPNVPNPDRYDVSFIIVHQKWLVPPGDLSPMEPDDGYDLALIRLALPVSTVEHATLNIDIDEVGKPALIVGFGFWGNGKGGSSQHWYLQPQMWGAAGGHNDIDAYGGTFDWSDNLILADFDSFENDGINTLTDGSPIPLPTEFHMAKRDSGGGWFIEHPPESGNLVLAGVNSGICCGNPGSYYDEIGRATRVSVHIPWINDVIAEEKRWVTAGGGDFSIPENWSQGVPRAYQAAIFDMAGVHIVTMPGIATTKHFRIEGGSDVMLDGIFTYTVSDLAALSAGSALHLAAGATLDVGELRVEGGSVVTLDGISACTVTDLTAISTGGTLHLRDGATIDTGELRVESESNVTLAGSSSHAITNRAAFSTDGTLDLGAGATLDAGELRVGEYGVGAVNQAGGTMHVTGDLHIGVTAGAVGSYRLTGGTLSVDGGVHGQLLGTDYFIIDAPAGAVDIAGDIAVEHLTVGQGAYDGVVSTLDITHGNVSSSVLTIGLDGTGQITQIGGTDTVQETLYIGVNCGADGTYNLAGGTLIADTINIGFHGHGQLNWTGGTIEPYTPGGAVTVNVWSPNGSFNIGAGLSFDGELNELPSIDVNTNGIPDECESDHMLVLIDRTGSMITPRINGHTRCEDALIYAADDVSTFFADNPLGAAAVWTFANTEPTPLTGFVGEAEALAAIDGLAPDGCDGQTPLAESICEAIDDLVASYPVETLGDRVLAISTDGGENASDGECDGFWSDSGPPPSGNYDLDSWQQRVYDRLHDNGVTAQARFWESFGQRGGKDREGGGSRNLPAVSDYVFLEDLAESSGGTFIYMDDNADDDCNGNGIRDACDIECGSSGGPCDLPDCGLSQDCDANGIPDECESDGDGDGVIDSCDDCPDTIPDTEVDEFGCPPFIPGDWDRDGDIDLRDFHEFQRCYGSGPSPACQDTFDADGDGDVDLDDWAELEPDMAGPNRPSVQLGDLFVVNHEGNNVKQYDSTTGELLAVFTHGAADHPESATFGPNGNLFVSYPRFNRVGEFDVHTGELIGDFITTNAGRPSHPRGMAFAGPEMNLFVVEGQGQQCLLEYDGITGVFIGEAIGSGVLSQPHGVTVGPDGDLYIVNYGSKTVTRYDFDNGDATTFIAADSHVDKPVRVVFGRDGNTYVSSLHGSRQVVVFDGVTGAFLRVFTSGAGGMYPYGLGFGPNGNLLVVDYSSSGEVHEFDGETGASIGSFIGSGLQWPTDLVFGP